MDHVVVRIGQLEEVYGTMESTPRGELRYHAETPEKRESLAELVEEYRQLADHRDGVLFRYLPPDEFLRRLLHKFNGASPYAVWGEIVEDSQGGELMGFPQEIHLTLEDEAALDQAVDEAVAEAVAERRRQLKQVLRRLTRDMWGEDEEEVGGW